MMRSRSSISRRTFLKGTAAGAGALMLSRFGVAAAQGGPSTSVGSYALPSAPGVDIWPILTVGDAVKFLEKNASAA